MSQERSGPPRRFKKSGLPTPPQTFPDWPLSAPRAGPPQVEYHHTGTHSSPVTRLIGAAAHRAAPTAYVDGHLDTSNGPAAIASVRACRASA